MKRRVIAGLACAGIGLAGCGSSDGNDYIDYERTGRGGANAAGGAGGTTGGGNTSTGTGGIGGNTPTGTGGIGGILPPPPPPPPGRGGAAGAAGGAGRAGGAGFDGGVYTEEVIESEDAPPPIAGGTLTITGQGHRAAVSDPDRDQVVVADLDSMTIVSTIALARGDEPGRIVEDGAGRLHVALRGGRAVAVLDPTAQTVLARLPVCVHPRGLAYDPTSDAIHVACVGGELVSYTASNGVLLRKLSLERDLRDVVIDGNRLLVSRFRAAELLVVESNGTVSGKLRPPTSPSLPPPPSAPPPPISPANRIAAVAWRTIPSPDGGALMVYQLLGVSSVPTTPGGYGGTCGGIITTAVSVLRVDGSGSTVENVPAVLPVDIATNASRDVAVAAAAWTPQSKFPTFGPFSVVTPPIPAPPPQPRIALGCARGPVPGGPPIVVEGMPQGRVVAIGYGPNQQVVLQTREPATLHMGDQTLFLPGRNRKHTGHELFHLGTAGGLACASCHPEGREDGQVWTFAGLGSRRTQSVSGGIAGTEPFHWSGDMTDFSKLSHDVFNSRMTGPTVSDAHVTSLFRWINTIPHLAAPVADAPDAVERGRALFNSPEVGCATCHNGEKLTNNATVSVETGGMFQVPSLLGLAWRAPYMHTGCAATLLDRFGNCGGGDAHGKTSKLSNEQRADLATYLDTL
jgi:hypothetical protein